MESSAPHVISYAGNAIIAMDWRTVQHLEIPVWGRMPSVKGVKEKHVYVHHTRQERFDCARACAVGFDAEIEYKYYALGE